MSAASPVSPSETEPAPGDRIVAHPARGSSADDGAHAFSVTVIIAMLSMLGPFTIDTIFPAFQHIGDDLGADTVALQQLTSSYLLSFAAMSLFHGPISDAVGRRPVMLTGLLVFAAASAGAALSESFTVLMVFRVIQGLAAGAAQIISRTLIRDLYSGVRAQQLMAQVSMIFSLAPALAPILGGVILRFASWHAIFWFLTCYALGMAALVLVALPETHPTQDRVPFNVATIGKSLIQVGRSPVFARLAAASSMGFASQFMYIASAPIFVVDLLDKGDQDFWIFFVPMITGMVVGSWFNSRLASRWSGRAIASTGFTVALLAGVANVVVSASPTAPDLPWAVLGPMVIAGGIALAFPVLQLEMLDEFPRLRGSAASLQAFVTLIINATLAGVVAPLVTGSVLTLALASFGFSCLAMAVWTWHARTPLKAVVNQ